MHIFSENVCPWQVQLFTRIKEVVYTAQTHRRITLFVPLSCLGLANDIKSLEIKTLPGQTVRSRHGKKGLWRQDAGVSLWQRAGELLTPDFGEGGRWEMGEKGLL